MGLDGNTGCCPLLLCLGTNESTLVKDFMMVLKSDMFSVFFLSLSLNTNIDGYVSQFSLEKRHMKKLQSLMKNQNKDIQVIIINFYNYEH